MTCFHNVLATSVLFACANVVWPESVNPKGNEEGTELMHYMYML